jgi:hypothetical protein
LGSTYNRYLIVKKELKFEGATLDTEWPDHGLNEHEFLLSPDNGARVGRNLTSWLFQRGMMIVPIIQVVRMEFVGSVTDESTHRVVLVLLPIPIARAIGIGRVEVAGFKIIHAVGIARIKAVGTTETDTVSV